ncbi:hypothetical protein AX768_18410 [Burkholderia sp. PAMC 28687]|nr:hypothetical protein AXG89_34105 [Burkholderia sp. PAMC 26561]AMM16182.1 hypothetical protein AX768_18410 [Burkholderia sp. PAMC 28687]
MDIDFEDMMSSTWIDKQTREPWTLDQEARFFLHLSDCRIDHLFAPLRLAARQRPFGARFGD